MSIKEILFPTPVPLAAASAALTVLVVFWRGDSPSGALPLVDSFLANAHGRLAKLLPAHAISAAVGGSETIRALVANCVLSLLLTAANVALLTLAWRQLYAMLLRYRGFLLEGRKVSTKTKLWFLALQYLFGSSKQTLGYQPYLAPLPVPAVDKTVERYLESMKPILSEAEWKQLEALGKQFVAESKPAQTALIRRQLTESNYLNQWWLDYVYLRQRSNIQISSNYYCFSLDMSPQSLGSKRPAARAALYLWQWVRCAKDIQRGSLAPQLIQKTVPLCMNQYASPAAAGLSLTRVPGREQDELKVTADWKVSNHVVVVRKGRYFVVEIFDGALLAAPSQIEASFEAVFSAADKEEESSSSTKNNKVPAQLAALTGWNRKEWATVREELLLKNPTNAAALAKIESAIMFISFDDHKEIQWDDLNGLGHSTMHGVVGKKLYPRWFDKSVTLVVDDNANIVANGEHSYSDAPMVGHMLDECMCTEAESKPYDSADGRVRVDFGRQTSARKLTPPAEMEFDSESVAGLRGAIESAAAHCIAQGNDVELVIERFDKFGKGVIARKLKLSPDAFLQMALQVAQFRLHGEFVQTYESALARLYLEGRTETIRACSPDAAAFARAMCAPDSKDNNKAEVQKLLRKACETHSTLTNRAMAGMGVDRHLFALNVAHRGASDDGAVHPFLESVFSRGWRLSTSQVPVGQCTRWKNGDAAPRANGGFGAVASDGYGVSYCFPSSDRIVVHVACYNSCATTSARKFSDAVMQAMEDMRALME